MIKKIASAHRKATVIAGGLGVLAFGGVIASAATLGTINNASLGAGVQVVASCDTDGVGVAYQTTFDTTSGKYKVTSVDVSGINAACVGKNLKMTLSNATFVAQGTVASTGVTGTPQNFAVTGNTDAGLVFNAAIVISD
jgi:hypothetical protein